MSTTSAALAGNYKQVYGDDIYSLIPESSRFIKRVPFEQKKKLGDFYHQPVVLTAEQGFTYSTSQTAFALEGNTPMASADAQLRGAQIAVQYRISQEAASRAIESAAAFKDATLLQYENVMDSFGKRLEIASLYGQKTLATFSTQADTSATTTTMTVDVASWAIGIWAGMENATFNFYNGASLISSGADSIFTLTTVDLDARTLLFTGTSTGTTALQAVAAGSLQVYFNTAYAGAMSGIDAIITNTGTLFNISAATYALWKGNTKTLTSGQLTLQRIINAMAAPVGRGLQGEVDVYVSPLTWSNLATDLAAMRMYDGSYSNAKLDNGTQSIEYYYQNGKMNVISHLFCKQGDCFVIPIKKFKRVGSTNITSVVPGKKLVNDDMFLMLPSNMGYESRMYTDQAIFC